MLLELRVENYAVIDNVAVEFAPGLNLLTGETGAGKSILIDALGTCCWATRPRLTRCATAPTRRVVSAVFEAESKALDAVLEENGIDGDEAQLILRREISAGGKGRVFVNNQPATVTVLRQLAPHLAVIHAQNEAVLAFDAASRLALLDSFAGSDLRSGGGGLRRVEQLFAIELPSWSATSKTGCGCSTCGTSSEKRSRAQTCMPEEDTKLEAEKRVLANSERILASAMGAYDALYEGNVSASALIRSAAKQLEELSRFDEKFREPLAQLDVGAHHR